MNLPPALTGLIAPEAFAAYTPTRQAALHFYALNKAAMDEGAQLLDAGRLPLHELYAQRAILRDRAWLCEVQQAPPKDERLKDLQLELDTLARRRVGPPRGVIPSWARTVLLSLDLGRHACHWEATAWDEAYKTSCLIDQGIQDTGLNRGGEYKLEDDPNRREILVETAILHALEAVHRRAAGGWAREDTGEIQPAHAVGVDVGGTAEKFAWQETVLRYCAKTPRWIPIKGAAWSERVADRALARHWICEDKNNPGRRVDADADYYKTNLYEALTAPVWKVEGLELFPGTRIFHKDTPNEYLRQHTSEKWIEQIKAAEAPSGKEYRVGWNRITSVPNHFWDAAWMNRCLAELCKHLRLGEAARARKKVGIIGKAFQ